MMIGEILFLCFICAIKEKRDKDEIQENTDVFYRFNDCGISIDAVWHLFWEAVRYRHQDCWHNGFIRFSDDCV